MERDTVNSLTLTEHKDTYLIIRKERRINPEKLRTWSPEVNMKETTKMETHKHGQICYKTYQLYKQKITDET